MSIANVVQAGFEASAAYDAYRPSYPAEAVDRLLEMLEVKGRTGARILDVGAGTGKFTELLAARAERYELTAVEPHDSMRKSLEQKRLNNVTVQKGTAEKMEQIAGQSFDAVTVAQAFHWMANMEALKEIHRVLKPTSGLGIIWNIEEHHSPKTWHIHTGWQSTMRDVMWSLEDGNLRFRDGKWKQVFDEQGRSSPLTIHSSDPLFGLPIGEDHVDFVRWSTKEEIWNTLTTYSQIATAGPDRLAEVEKTFWDAINSSETETNDEGKVAIHGKTVIYWTSKIPNEPIKNGL